MTQGVVPVADELEELRKLKARYCRFLDTKDVESWRSVFTTDVVVTLDTAVSVGGADPMTAPPIEGVDNFVPTVLGGLEGVATMHHCHTRSSPSPRPRPPPASGRWRTSWSSATVARCGVRAITARPTRRQTAPGGSRACT